VAYTTIDDPSAHFQTALYTGTGSSHSITNDGNSDLQPDWVWIKERDGTGQHGSFDSSRGVQKELKIDENGAEATAAQGVTAFNSDGFTVGTAGDYNGSSNLQVAWQWKANGGTTSSNTDGNVTVTLQANTTAGFSIGTWTSNGGTSGTIGHGLGARPDIVITKNRDSSSNWNVIVPDYAGNEMGFLQTTAAFGSASGINTVGSSTFTDGDGADSDDRVFYAFRSIQGYSKIGQYTGNGDSFGPFVYTGFSPSFVMIKCTSQTESWFINDTTRSVDNPTLEALIPNQTAVENTTTGYSIDILSNGFKCRDDAGQQNEGSGNYIYMAFAEQPFVSSDGVPATAR